MKNDLLPKGREKVGRTSDHYHLRDRGHGNYSLLWIGDGDETQLWWC